jgi:hypothetical protein
MVMLNVRLISWLVSRDVAFALSGRFDAHQRLTIAIPAGPEL